MLNLRFLEEKKVFDKELKVCSSDCCLIGGRDKVLKFKKEHEEAYKDLSVGGYINSIQKYKNNIYFVGFQTGTVYMFDVDKYYEDNTHSGTFIYAHTDNVCSMNVCENYLVTGSWDHTCIIYNIETNTYFMVFKHEGSVWTCKLRKGTNSMHIITGCADGIIRFFKFVENEQMKQPSMIEYHNYPIRDIVLDEDYVYSVDNEGFIYKFSKTGEILNIRNSHNLTFTMCVTDKYIVTAGENGIIVVLSKDLVILNKFQIEPNVTLWKIFSTNNKLFACCSNGKLYTMEFEDSEGEIKGKYVKSVHTDTKAEEIEEKNNSKDEVKDQVFKQGNKTYKIEKGQVFEENDSGSWVLIGQAAGATKYDHTINVDLDGTNYVLNFNKGDNYYEVAAEFMKKNKIPDRHQDEIVEFINANCRENNYKFHENIYIDGLRNYFQKNNSLDKTVESVLNTLQMLVMDKTYQIEDFDKFEKECLKIKETETFVFYDICKFLAARDIYFDLSFVFRDKIDNKKEAKAFVMLCANFYRHLPFKWVKIDKTIRHLRDNGFVSITDCDFYEHNKKLFMTMKNK